MAGLGGIGAHMAMTGRGAVPRAFAAPAFADAGPAAAPRHGGYGYGAAIRSTQISDDAPLKRIVEDECGWIVPEIEMNWNFLQPAPGIWNFAGSDAIVRFGLENGKSVRGHMLIWEKSTPDWVRQRLLAPKAEGGADWGIVENHFATVLGRYAPYVPEWDVVNEAIDTEDGDNGLRRTSFQRAFGAGYVARALHSARAHAPDARLIVNEFSLEYANPVDRARRLALLKLLEGLRRDGAPIDGIGLQAHLDLDKGDLATVEIRDFLKEIRALGLTVTITELDVKEANLNLAVAERDRRIADHVRQYLETVLAEQPVSAVITWGISDRDSWLQASPPPDSARELNRGLPFDAGLAPKPFYWTMREILRDHGGNPA